jgi:hypothetical protein
VRLSHGAIYDAAYFFLLPQKSGPTNREDCSDTEEIWSHKVSMIIIQAASR